MSETAVQEQTQAAPNMSPGIISWNELATSDASGSSEFYTKLFGWEPVPMPGMEEYKIMKAGDEMVAGVMDKSEHCDGPALWVSYVTVADVKASLAKAVELGGEEIKGVTAVPGKGSFAIVKDPQGAIVGLWEFSGEGCC